MWMRFETDAAYHFDFFLAAKLGRTVAELVDGIDNEEYTAWSIYFGRIAQQKDLQQKLRR